VLYNGVDTAAFHPRHRDLPAGVATGDPTVLAVGRLVEKKGFHLLLAALAQLAAAGQTPRCLLVGDGEERARLHAAACTLGLSQVEFLGLRTHEEVRDLVHRATMLVLPCIVGQDGNRDALPTVLLEALAAGTPVISTPVGGVEEIVADGAAGVLVPAGEVAPLATAIGALCHDAGRRAQLAAAGRARAERLFDLATNVSRLRDWFAAAIAGTPLPGAAR
jgi:glycosyltransferase involved in cell wall biosynthesis